MTKKRWRQSIKPRQTCGWCGLSRKGPGAPHCPVAHGAPYLGPRRLRRLRNQGAR